MMRDVRSWLPITVVALLMVVIPAFWLASRALLSELPEPVAREQPAAEGFMSMKYRPATERKKPAMDDEVATNAGAIPNQRVIAFKDRKALDAFLVRGSHGVEVLGVLGALNMARVGFTDMASLMKELGEGDEPMLVFPIIVPPLPDGEVSPGAVPIGDQILAWLGVENAAATWGQGVKIAVLDTGVVPDASLGTVAQLIELVPSGNDLSVHNGHATAVASLMVGRGEMVAGIAPAAEIISVRVANDAGESNSFLLAQGIIEATNAGAQLINISMGGYGYSKDLQEAVNYALAHGSLVIASSGNNGVDRVNYPAAMDGVIGVGAVDALGRHLDFSNSGAGVDVAAPGLGVYANWMDGRTVSVSGTSFSTPIVTGVLAAVMTGASSERMSPTQAWELVGAYLNDGGLAGPDPQLGGGMPDLGRILLRDTPGIRDAALASLSLLPPDAGHPYGQIEVLVQNRGTEPLMNTQLGLETNGVLQRVNLSMLDPGAVQTVRAPVTQPLDGRLSTAFELRGTVSLVQGWPDAKPENDSQVFSSDP